jgi:hypothetical protein
LLKEKISCWRFLKNLVSRLISYNLKHYIL